MSIKHLKTFKMWDKILEGVWYYILNNSFQFLNNITHIFTQFFIRTYFKKINTDTKPTLVIQIVLKRTRAMLDYLTRRGDDDPGSLSYSIVISRCTQSPLIANKPWF